MQQHKSRLEITTLTWSYDERWGDAIHFLYDDRAPKEKQQYVLLPEHECDYPSECGLCLTGVEIDVADDGHGVCNILHPGCTRSGASRHEFEVLGKHLSAVFTNGEAIRVGGASRTVIEFDKRPNEPLTDTAMEIYKKFLGILGVTEYKDAKGPSIVRRSYFWSIDLGGWIAFEDRLALRHDFKPIHARRAAHSGSPIEIFRWPN